MFGSSLLDNVDGGEWVKILGAIVTIIGAFAT